MSHNDYTDYGGYNNMKLFIKRLLSRIATPLPVGITEFDQWAESIIELSGEFADKDSMKFAIASNLIHLDHKIAKMPKAYFVNTLRKAAANQVASAVFQSIKLSQDTKRKEAEEVAKLQQAEDSAAKQAAECQTPSTTS